MGEMFSENDYREMIEECRNFKSRCIKPDEREVYLQLVYEKENINGVEVAFDVYPHRFLYYLIDNVLTPRLRRPLFSYRVELEVGDAELCVYQEYKNAAQRNNGWLSATLCDKEDPECTFVGQLVWQCGDVDYSETGIKMQYDISSKVMKDIKRTTSVLRKRNECKNPFDFLENSGELEEKDSKLLYDVFLYRVGNANTTYILNKQNGNSLLVDCGIERTVKYRKLYIQAENEIKKLNPEYILLSHNHEDHYNILFKSVSAQSVALKNTNVKMTALKQVIISKRHMNSLNQLIILDSLRRKIVFLDSNINNYQKILMGKFPNVFIEFGNRIDKKNNVGGRNSYLENDTGIIVSIHNKKNVVLPGDCSYDYIPHAVGLDAADYIVLPHHGGRVIMKNAIKMKKNCIPIVSSGFKQLYKGAYNQEDFLKSCGVNTSLMKFLKTVPNLYYMIKDV